MFGSQSQASGSNRFENVMVNFPQQQPQQQQNQQNTHPQQFQPTSQQPQQMLFQPGSSINNSSNQREPGWFNNPRKRTIPQAIVKRTTKRSSSVDSTQTDNDSSTRTDRSGFNSITFGSKKDANILPSTQNINVLKKPDHTTGFLDSNEAPPTVSLYDWQREDDFGAIHPLGSNVNKPSSAFDLGQSQLSSTPSIRDNITEGSESNAFDKKNKSGSSVTQNITSSENSGDNNSSANSAIQESAVIVFGYPESISNLIIMHFSKFGKILEDFEVLRSSSGINTTTLRLRGNKTDLSRQERKYPIFTGDGWVKLTYDTSASAIRALQENGRVFGGSLIGCVPYNKNAVEQLASCHIENVDDIGGMNFPTARVSLEDARASPSEKNEDKLSTEKGVLLGSAIFSQDEERPFESTSNDILHRSKVGYPSRRLDIKDGKSLFVHNGASSNHNFLQSLEVKMRQQEENNKKEAGVLHKVNNWLFGWNEL